MLKFRKRAIFSVCFLMLCALMLGYGTQAQGKTVTIRLSYVNPRTHSVHIAFEEVKKFVDSTSEGNLKLELYPDGQLAGERQAIEAVQLGVFEMTYPTTSVLSNFEPVFQVFDLPYLFSSRSVADKVLDEGLGVTLLDKLPQRNLIGLGYAENGFRHVTNNKRPIKSPEDLEGIKIRTMESPIHMESFRALGANPTPISFTELYTALQQGTVDAQENPISLIYTSKFYEVQKYCSLTGHFYTPGILLINKMFFESLDPDLQSIIRQAAKLYTEKQREINRQQDAEYLVKLKEYGMMVNEIEDKERFAETVKPVYEKFAPSFGDEIVEEVNKIREMK